MRGCEIVMGCGNRGASWINQQEGGSIIGLDNKRLQVKAPLIEGDVFALPIRSESISQIYGDFIINGLIERDIAAQQINQNPDVLDTGYFPSLVRNWFNVSMQRNHDSVRREIKEVSNLLKMSAMREMWRVLAVGGRLQILDYRYNTNWVTHYAPYILGVHPTNVELEPLRITPDDYIRSSNLDQGVVRGSTYVDKVALTKVRR